MMLSPNSKAFVKIIHKKQFVKPSLKRTVTSLVDLTTVKKVKSDLIFPLPPATQTIQGDEDCSKSIQTCKIDQDKFKECFKCKQYNWTCNHYDIEFQFGNIKIPPNKIDEGYCTPSNDVDLNTLNDYTSQLVLINGDTGLYFAVQCKYPNLFTHSNQYSNCSTFINPCGEFSLMNVNTGADFDPTQPIDFDPFVYGRCNVPDGSQYIATWTDTDGPSIKLKLYYETDQPSCPDLSNKTSLADLTASGYKASVVTRFTTQTNLICLPTPCAYDPRTGDFVGGVFNSQIKACECPIDTSIPVREEQDGDGNAIDAANQYPNACMSIGETVSDTTYSDKKLFIEFANVQPNSTPQTYVLTKLDSEKTALVGSSTVLALYQRPARWHMYENGSNELFGWDYYGSTLPPYLQHFRTYKATDGTTANVILSYPIFQRISQTNNQPDFVGTIRDNWIALINETKTLDGYEQTIPNSTEKLKQVINSTSRDPTRTYISRNVKLVLMGGSGTTAGVYTSFAIVPNPTIDGFKSNILISAINPTGSGTYFVLSWRDKEQLITEDKVDTNLLFLLPSV